MRLHSNMNVCISGYKHTSTTMSLADSMWEARPRPPLRLAAVTLLFSVHFCAFMRVSVALPWQQTCAQVNKPSE